MRIVFWQEVFWPNVGGVPAQAEWLLPALRQRGHEIVVVTRQDTLDLAGSGYWESIRLHRLPFWQALGSSAPRAVLVLQHDIDRLQRDFEPDLIHLNGFGPTAFFVLQAKRTLQTPLLVALHSHNTLTAGTGTLIEHTLASADWVTACSRALLGEARRCVPAIASRSSEIYNGVPTPPVGPAPLPFAPPRLLCLGQLADHKGFDLAIDAAAALRSRFPTLRTIIAGNGPARAGLERRACAAGIRPFVAFPGLVPRTDVPRLINGATVVLVPSRRESFGLVAVEAALLARPVVAARVGGLPEIIAHEETGLLVPPEDPAALAGAIASLLDDPRSAERMGKAARDRALSRFTLAAQCDAYEAIYQRIRNGHRMTRPRNGVEEAVP